MRTLTVGGMISLTVVGMITVQLGSSLTRLELTKIENMFYLYVVKHTNSDQPYSDTTRNS